MELHDLLDRLEEESVKKGLNSKTEIMVVSNRKSSWCELRIACINIKESQKAKEDRKGDTDIRTHIGLANDTFQT